MNAGFALVFLSTIASAVLAFFSLSVTWSLFTPGAQSLGRSFDSALGLFMNGWWVAAAVGAVVGLVSGLVVPIILDGLPARPVYRMIPLVSIGVGVVTAPFLLFLSAIAVVAAQLLAAWALYAKLHRPKRGESDSCPECGESLHAPESASGE